MVAAAALGAAKSWQKYVRVAITVHMDVIKKKNAVVGIIAQ